ncbi:hypothetical protein EDD11_001697, partial [Mortierella claussenii]
CVDAPPSQKALAQIPIQKSFRKNSTIGHFYVSCSGSDFQCQVKNDSGDICGLIYKKKGSGKSRTKHIIQMHAALYYALQEFRDYQ